MSASATGRRPCSAARLAASAHSGHHSDVGAWWVVQLGYGLGLATISSLGLQRG
jgi:hypothetical protein